MSAPEQVSFEVRLANGERERCESLWAARHVVARRVAFDVDPLDPRNVLPAEIWRRGKHLFGGGSYVETIRSADELTAIESSGP